jgi:hypothetical protein
MESSLRNHDKQGETPYGSELGRPNYQPSSSSTATSSFTADTSVRVGTDGTLSITSTPAIMESVDGDEADANVVQVPFRKAPDANSGERVQTRSSNGCYYCEGKGHRKTSCPQLKRDNPKLYNKIQSKLQEKRKGGGGRSGHRAHAIESSVRKTDSEEAGAVDARKEIDEFPVTEDGPPTGPVSSSDGVAPPVRVDERERVPKPSKLSLHVDSISESAGIRRVNFKESINQANATDRDRRFTIHLENWHIRAGFSVRIALLLAAFIWTAAIFVIFSRPLDTREIEGVFLREYRPQCDYSGSYFCRFFYYLRDSVIALNKNLIGLSDWIAYYTRHREPFLNWLIGITTLEEEGIYWRFLLRTLFENGPFAGLLQFFPIIYHFYLYIATVRVAWRKLHFSQVSKRSQTHGQICLTMVLFLALGPLSFCIELLHQSVAISFALQLLFVYTCFVRMFNALDITVMEKQVYTSRRYGFDADDLDEQLDMRPLSISNVDVERPDLEFVVHVQHFRKIKVLDKSYFRHNHKKRDYDLTPNLFMFGECSKHDILNSETDERTMKVLVQSIMRSAKAVNYDQLDVQTSMRIEHTLEYVIACWKFRVEKMRKRGFHSVSHSTPAESGTGIATGTYPSHS